MSPLEPHKTRKLDMTSDDENTIPDDLASMLGEGTSEESSATEPSASAELPQDESGEDTGESGEVQAEAAAQAQSEADLLSELTADQAETVSDAPISAHAPPKIPSAPEIPKWIEQISRYHNDMNGLLAGKENLKIMSVNKSVRISFYKKWVFESNQLMRLTVNLRHRKKRAMERLNNTTAPEVETKKVG